jgi:hypothetical protein
MRSLSWKLPIVDSEFAGMLEHPIQSIQELHSLNLIGVGDVVIEREEKAKKYLKGVREMVKEDKQR